MIELILLWPNPCQEVANYAIIQTEEIIIIIDASVLAKTRFISSKTLFQAALTRRHTR